MLQSLCSLSPNPIGITIYKPGNILEVKIPKEGSPGKYRTLGISNFEDKLCQKMMKKVLENIYEPLFLKCSYGFRAGIGCHDAVRELSKHLYEKEVESIIDLDLANFFGTVDRKILIEILQEKVQDMRLIRYLIRMFKSGVLSDGELTIQEEGVIAGALCKATYQIQVPIIILLHFTLHNVLD
ncbi:reverse transcriptase domain-containing protein [Candidatus Tisiphia endosymbiont of Hybos culiciformis]|uniref:reverse transcriptase domain-containing protein n=1 Tax=Candidatus Tisiphia endosymbiont of Hybos culiciformis TaxID=3139331 RepID=UPI003CCA77DD